MRTCKANQGNIMKSRSTELLDRAIFAMAAAIELYNKPGFPYRNESFCILAINSWELVIKSKWLAMHGHNPSSLYVYEYRSTKNGRSKRKYIKRTKSNAPFTHDIRYLAGQLVANGTLDQNVLSNIEGLLEFRNRSIHYYNRSATFEARLYEVSAACVRNFKTIVDEWFGRSVAEFGIFLMPLTFLDSPRFDSVVLRADEEQFFAFLETLDHGDSDITSPYTVAINVDVKFTRSTTRAAALVQRSRDPSAIPITLTEEDLRDIYPWDYATLTEKCQQLYDKFKINQDYHDLRKRLQTDARFGHERHLDPTNPLSQKKVFYSPNIIVEFDKHYKRST